MRVPTKLIPLALALLSLTPVFSQKKAEKWGSIPAEDLAMSVYPQDSAAAAVILQDLGDIELVEGANRYDVIFRQHRRIKVFDPSAFAEGNLRIPYSTAGGGERLADLDVQIILPDGQKQKVKSDNVFTEKITKYWSAKKVFIPNLQKGCIIEYRFELRSSQVHTLHDWYFQGELPTRRSEVKVATLPYFEYVTLTRLPRPFDEKEEEQVGGATRARYVFHHLPAIREEPFVTTLDDYRAHIGFQLARIAPIAQPETKFMTTWADLAKVLEDLSEFGWRYRREGECKDLWRDFSALLQAGGGESDEAVAAKALRFVSERIKWTEGHGLLAPKRLDEVYARQTGSSAELNLTLVALLRRAKLDAVPMLLSTRENGAMYPQYPFRDQFNSVVAFVRQGQGGLLLDATRRFLPVGQVSTEHYNGSGWLVDSKHPDWLDLVPPETSVTWYGQLALAESGEMSGRFSVQATGPMAADWREELSGAHEKDFLKKNFAAEYPDIAFDSIALTGKDALDKPLKIEFHCRIPNTANVVNDFIYCRPVLDFVVSENPFKSPRRNFPVDFAHPLKANYVLYLSLPPGYAVEELPETARIALQGDGGKISFICAKQSASSVQIQLRMNLGKTSFSPDEYGSLRQFFDLAAEKTQLQLVLKKI
jgi:hypothetical protein